MIKQFLVWLLYKNSAVWLFYILAFECYVAMNLSPTILSDFPVLNSFVEFMSFIPAVHNFDDRAVHPEAISFYIALVFVLIIPKSLAVNIWLQHNTMMWKQQLVITPLTTSSPASSQLRTRLSKTEKEIEALPVVKRTRISAVFWSMMILFFAIGMLWVLLTFGYGSQDTYVHNTENLVSVGGVRMWSQLSLKLSTFCALLIAISALIIQDYFKWFLSFFKRINKKEKQL